MAWIWGSADLLSRVLLDCDEWFWGGLVEFLGLSRVSVERWHEWLMDAVYVSGGCSWFVLICRFQNAKVFLNFFCLISVWLVVLEILSIMSVELVELADLRVRHMSHVQSVTFEQDWTLLSTHLWVFHLRLPAQQAPFVWIVIKNELWLLLINWDRNLSVVLLAEINRVPELPLFQMLASFTDQKVLARRVGNRSNRPTPLFNCFLLVQSMIVIILGFPDLFTCPFQLRVLSRKNHTRPTHSRRCNAPWLGHNGRLRRLPDLLLLADLALELDQNIGLVVGSYFACALVSGLYIENTALSE